MTPEIQDVQIIEVLHEDLKWDSTGIREYRLPFKLSHTPSEAWVRTFDELRGGQYSTILKREASIYEDRLVLHLNEADDQTHHVRELKRVVDFTNNEFRKRLQEKEEANRANEEHQRQRDEKMEEIRQKAKNLKS